LSDQYILDSYAVLALLGKEPGHDCVFELLNRSKKGKAWVAMTWVNVGEVAYIVQRRWDISHVHQILANLESSKVVFVEVEQQLALKAADLKADFPIAYADAYAAALAEMKGAVLITGDPEFKVLENKLSIEWIK
jgi:ribonuclease VapC